MDGRGGPGPGPGFGSGPGFGFGFGFGFGEVGGGGGGHRVPPWAALRQGIRTRSSRRTMPSAVSPRTP